MDFTRLINTLTRMFTRKAVNFGIRKGTDMMAGKGKPGASAAHKAQSQTARETAKRARQAARITRRLGR